MMASIKLLIFLKTHSQAKVAPDSRSKRGATIDPQGFDAGKKVAGRKRHILVDTLGLLLGVGVLP